MTQLERDAFRTGKEVSGPLFVPFCKWVVEQALRLKVSHIIYLARDGQLLHKMTQKLYPELSDIKLLYSYAGSRASWYPCLPHSINEATLLFRIQNEYKNLENTCLALGIALEDLPETIDLPVNQILSKKEAAHIAKTLISDEGKQILRIASESARRNFLRYFLIQEEIPDRSSIAIVDVGWNGNFQTALDDMVPSNRQITIYGLYYGLNRNQSPSNRFSFAFAQTTFPHWASLYPCLIEMLTPADHAAVMGFAGQDFVTPIFRGDPVAPLSVIENIHAGALNSIDSLDPDFSLRRYIESPPSWLIRVFNEFSFQSPFFPNVNESFIQTHTLTQVISLRLSLKRNLAKWHWPQANLAMSGMPGVGVFITEQFQVLAVFNKIVGKMSRKVKGALYFAWSLMVGVVPRKHAEIVSFDLFDTLIYRECGDPYKVLQELEVLVGINNFAEKRKGLEAYLLVKAKGAEIGFDDIYNEFKKREPDRNWDEIKELELQLEQNNLRRSKRLYNLLQKHRAAGRKIVFISDMYHSSQWLREQMEMLGLWQPNDTLIVSSEYKVTKRRGPLFIKAKEVVNAETWIHYGDNVYSDVINAYRNGLTPRWIPHSYWSTIKALVLKNIRSFTNEQFGRRTRTNSLP